MLHNVSSWGDRYMIKKCCIVKCAAWVRPMLALLFCLWCVVVALLADGEFELVAINRLWCPLWPSEPLALVFYKSTPAMWACEVGFSCCLCCVSRTPLWKKKHFQICGNSFPPDLNHYFVWGGKSLVCTCSCVSCVADWREE